MSKYFLGHAYCIRCLETEFRFVIEHNSQQVAWRSVTSCRNLDARNRRKSKSSKDCFLRHILAQDLHCTCCASLVRLLFFFSEISCLSVHEIALWKIHLIVGRTLANGCLGMKGAALLKLFLCLFLFYDIIVNFRTLMNYQTMLQPWEAAFFHFLSFCQHWLNHSIHYCKKKEGGREQQFRHLHCALLQTFSQALHTLPLTQCCSFEDVHTWSKMCGPVVLPKKKNKFLSSARPPESDKFAAMFATPSWNCSLNFQVTCQGIE